MKSTTTNLISKKGLQQTFEGKDAAPPFAGKTGIMDAISVSETEVENIRAKYNLYNLQNISLKTANMKTGANGTLNCDSSFVSLMKKRRDNTLLTRLRSINWNIFNVFWLVGAIGFYFLATLVKPSIAEEDAENAQLLRAQKIVQSGSWKKDVSNKALRYPSGPLKIDIVAWDKTQRAAQHNDSLQKSYDAAVANKDSLIAILQNQAENKVRPLKKQFNKKIDSLSLKAKSDAAAILEPAQKEFQEVSKPQNNSNKSMDQIQLNSRAAKQNLEKAQKDAGKILQKAQDDRIAFEKKAQQQISLVESDYQKKIDSLSNAVEKYGQTLEKSAIQETSYPYDLSNPSLGWGYAALYWILNVIGIGMLLYFLFLSGKLLKELPKKELNERQTYTSNILRIMAFPNFQSQLPKNYNSNCTDIVFHNISAYAVEKLVSVGLRYPIHVLIHQDAFEFNEVLLNHEKLTDEQKLAAPKPLFYTIDGDQAIFFSGLAGEMTKEEVEQANKPVEL